MVIGNPCECVEALDDQDWVYTLCVRLIDQRLQGFARIVVLVDLEFALDVPGQLLAKLAHEVCARRNAVWRNPNHGRAVIAAMRGEPKILCCPRRYRRRGCSLVAAIRGHEQEGATRRGLPDLRRTSFEPTIVASQEPAL